MTANRDAILRAVEALQPAVVLVDYFDTVVTRRTTPRGVERAACRHLAERFGLASSVEAVHQARGRAEELVGTEMVAAGLDPEYRLDEVAALMWQLLGDQGERERLGSDPSKFVAAATEIGLAVERSAQVVDAEVVGALTEVAADRPLILVSDFYLPGELFGPMLAERGLGELFTQRFVSCDARLSKASGRMYPHVLAAVGAQEPIEPGQVLMIGDNPVSDIARAAEHGLATVRIERPPAGRAATLHRRLAGRWPERRRAIGEAIESAGSPPFAELAVTLFVFTRLLHRMAWRDGWEPLAFLAREGQFLRELFELYQRLHPAAAGAQVGSAYLVVSRRSTLLAGLAPLDDENFEPILSAYPDLSLANLVGSLGFTDDVARRVATELGVEADQPVEADLLGKSEELRRCYEPARAEQAGLLRCYVEQVLGTAAADEGGPLGLNMVDVGFKGTIQDNLRRALGQERDVRGAYLGITAEGPVADSERKRAVMFDSRLPVTPSYRVLRHFKLLYELVLQADHGSAARYELAADRVEPVLDTQQVEVEDFERYVRPLQEGILDVFAELCREDGCRQVPLVGTVDEAASVHARMLFFPRRSEVDLIRSMRHYENYGEMGIVGAGSAPRGRRLSAIAALAVKPTRILASGWPPFALTELGLWHLIPVVGAYRTIRELWLPKVQALRRR